MYDKSSFLYKQKENSIFFILWNFLSLSENIIMDILSNTCYNFVYDKKSFVEFTYAIY